MTRKFIATLAATVFTLATLAPTGASAQRWRGHDGYDGRGPDAYGCVDDDNYGCERDRDRRIARRGGYGYGNDYGYDRGYGYGNDCYDRHGRNRCYDRRRDDNDDDAVVAGVVGLVLGAVIGSAITSSGNQRNQGYQQCTRQERRWDRSSQRYYTVDVPC